MLVLLLLPLFLQLLILIAPSINVTTATGTSAPVITAALIVPDSNFAVATTAGTATKYQ